LRRREPHRAVLFEQQLPADQFLLELELLDKQQLVE
jgi:hypothetical protein